MSARAARSAPRSATSPSRRRFVQGSLAALAGARVPRLARPSDELRVVIVGLNGCGADHAAALHAVPGVRIAALCDVDDFVLSREARKLREGGWTGSVNGDLRRVLERDDVDAVVLATPDHWHALQTLWACRAGKDVFVESPSTHAFAEGARLVASAAKHARIVHCGYPARSSPALRAAIDWLHAGNLGAPTCVRALCYEARPSIGQSKGNRHIPDIVDYDLWCGPGPLLPLRRAKLHHDWRWLFAYGDGELGSGAAHVLDVARWVLGAEDPPASVHSLGARVGYSDDGETPNTQIVLYAYAPTPIVLEVRGLPSSSAAQAGDWSARMDDFLGVKVGVVVHCENGVLRIHGDALATACDGDGKEIQRWEGSGAPLARWLEAVKTRDAAASGIESSVRSDALVHLGNASHRAGQRLVKDDLWPEIERLHLDVWLATCQRTLEHLDKNGVDLLRTELTLGARLELDPKTGALREPPSAAALLAGSYREPFVLPDA